MSIFANILGVMGDFIVDGVNGVRMKVVSNVMQFRSQGDVSHRGIQVRDIKIMNDNASNGITLTAPASQGSNITHTLPGTAGNTGDVWTKKADGTIGYESPGQSGGVSGFYVGDYKTSAQSASHGKWLLCDGAAVSRTTYAALFALIGTAFGSGNGSTTFNLPDGRGRALIGVGQGSGLTNRALGAIVGTEAHQLSISEVPAHVHDLFASNGVTLRQSNGGVTSSATGLNPGGIFITGTPPVLQTMGSGGGGSHNNMQPSLAAGNLFIYTG